MIFSTLIAAAALISGTTAAPGLGSLAKRQSTPNGEGTHDGYFYS
jgi:endo-1,4-beta-xylanase